MAASEGPWSRLAGLASASWGLVVWVFGESFGGIFAPGLPWLFGAPGAAGFYCAAGVLVALPERYWRSPRLGRAVLAVMGMFFAGMAVLQAWPGRGFWQGTEHGRPGTLAGITASMAQAQQPGFLAAWVRAFTSFDPARGAACDGGVPRCGVPGRLGAHRGPRLLRRPRHRPEQHDPAAAAGRCRLPGPDPCARPCRGLRPCGAGRVAGPVPPGHPAPGDRRCQRSFGGLSRGGRGNPARRGADGGRPGKPYRRPDRGRAGRRAGRPLISLAPPSATAAHGARAFMLRTWCWRTRGGRGG